ADVVCPNVPRTADCGCGAYVDPDSDRYTNGWASASCLAITGSRMSVGRRPRTRDTLSRTSWAATSTGRSRLNSSVMRLSSSWDVLVRVRSPWMVESSSSSTSVTAVSTTWALAPGSVVTTEITGASTSGNSRTDSRV